MNDEVQKKADPTTAWQQEYRIRFDEFNENDDLFNNSPSGQLSPNETFEEKIRRKTSENLRKIFGDG